MKKKIIVLLLLLTVAVVTVSCTTEMGSNNSTPSGNTQSSEEPNNSSLNSSNSEATPFNEYFVDERYYVSDSLQGAVRIADAFSEKNIEFFNKIIPGDTDHSFLSQITFENVKCEYDHTMGNILGYGAGVMCYSITFDASGVPEDSAFKNGKNKIGVVFIEDVTDIDFAAEDYLYSLDAFTFESWAAKNDLEFSAYTLLTRYMPYDYNFETGNFKTEFPYIYTMFLYENCYNAPYYVVGIGAVDLDEIPDKYKDKTAPQGMTAAELDAYAKRYMNIDNFTVKYANELKDYIVSGTELYNPKDLNNINTEDYFYKNGVFVVALF